MLYLTEEQKALIKKSNHYWITINGKNYYVKKHRIGILFSELIAKRVFAILNIRNANYEAVLINNDLYYLSEDLNNYGKFSRSEILQVKVSSLYDYWTSFEKLYKTSAKVLMDELIKIYLFDIIMMHSDRNCGGWGILTNEEGSHLSTLDNEAIFHSNPTVNITSYFIDEKKIPYDKYKSKKYKPFYKKEESLKDFENFLQNFSKYIPYVEELLNSLSPDILKEIIEDIEQEYNVPINDKESWLAKYTENYEALKELLKKHKGLTI